MASNAERNHAEVAEDEDCKKAKQKLVAASISGTPDLIEKAKEEYIAAADKVWKPATDMEKSDAGFAASVGAKHTVGEIDIKTTNPNYASGEYRWTNNCQRCVPCYEMIRRGWKVTTLPVPPELAPDYLRGGHWYAAFDCQKSDAIHWKSKEDCERKLLAWGEGARAEIRCKWKGGGGDGHVFFAEVVNGKVVFQNPQDPRKIAAEYFRAAPTRGRWAKYNSMLRIDNRPFSSRILECVKV